MADYRKVIEVIISTINKSGPGSKEAASDLQKFGAEATKVGSIMATVGTTVVSALAGISVAAANSADTMRDLAIRSGSTVENMSTLRFAAAQTGTSIDAVANAMKLLAKNAVDADHGSKELSDGFTALGVSVRDSGGELKTSQQLLLDVADGMSKLKDPTLATNLSLRILGQSSIELTELLSLGSAGILEYQARARALGAEISGTAAAAADNFNGTIEESTTAIGGLNQAISEALLPTLTDLATKATQAIVAVQAFARDNPGIVQGILGISAVLIGAGGLVVAIGALSTAATVATPVLTAFWAAVTGPVGLVAAAAVAVGALALKVRQLNKEYLESDAFRRENRGVNPDRLAEVQALSSGTGRVGIGGGASSRAAAGAGGSGGAGGSSPETGAAKPAEPPPVDTRPGVRAGAPATFEAILDPQRIEEVGLAFQQALGEQVFLAAANGITSLQQSFGGFASFAVGSITQVGDAFGQGFVRALLQGKNVLTEVGKALSQWAIDAVADLAAVIAKAAILAGLFSLFGFGGGGGFGGAFKKILGFAGGGMATGGIAGRDSIPAFYQPGELVMPKDVSSAFRQIMSGGGLSASGGSVNVTISAGAFMGSRNDALEYARQVKFALDELTLGKRF